MKASYISSSSFFSCAAAAAAAASRGGSGGGAAQHDLFIFLTPTSHHLRPLVGIDWLGFCCLIWSLPVWICKY